MNETLKLYLMLELFTHLSAEEQDQVISLIVSILSEK